MYGLPSAVDSLSRIYSPLPSHNQLVLRFDGNNSDATGRYNVVVTEINAPGGATYTTGKFGQATQNTVNPGSTVEVGSVIPSPVSGTFDSFEFSISMWVRTSYVPGNSNVMMVILGTIEEEEEDLPIPYIATVFRLMINPGYTTDKSVAFMEFGFGNNSGFLDNFNNGTWTHIAFNFENGVGQLWINGVAVRTLASPVDYALTGDTILTIVLGGGVLVDDLAFRVGTIDQALVDTIYNSGTGRLFPLR